MKASPDPAGTNPDQRRPTKSSRDHPDVRALIDPDHFRCRQDRPWSDSGPDHDRVAGPENGPLCLLHGFEPSLPGLLIRPLIDTAPQNGDHRSTGLVDGGSEIVTLAHLSILTVVIGRISHLGKGHGQEYLMDAEPPTRSRLPRMTSEPPSGRPTEIAAHGATCMSRVYWSCPQRPTVPEGFVNPYNAR